MLFRLKDVSYQLTKGDKFSYSDAFIATLVGALTQGKGFVMTQSMGLSGSYAGSLIKGEDPILPMIGSFAGTTIGFKGGPFMSNTLKPYIGEAAATTVGNSSVSYLSEMIGDGIQSLGGKK
ncbi:hypothetical protein CFN16_15570 [Pseudomonas fluorescens]|uniref:Uncharacterized protein n=1 Tax=Pseudomonas fluorescens TaxID=294 RepID=A0A345UYD6_PSEFL|nr:hypothetical protein [Pseudomonas fluorescens]AXJ05488.1 hypothetical protein CFN16_15570 [Pseudomonas fluorescens]